MKGLLFLILLCIFSSLSGQELINTISKEVCKCLEAEEKKDTTEDFQKLIETCFQESMITHLDALIEEYGEEILSDENTTTAYNLGVDLGTILAKECSAFLNIIVNQKKRENETSETLFKLGQEKSNNGLYDDAIELYSKAINSNKENHEYYNSKGLAYLSKGMY